MPNKLNVSTLQPDGVQFIHSQVKEIITTRGRERVRERKMLEMKINDCFSFTIKILCSYP